MQDFATAVTNINALDIPSEQKNDIIARLVLASQTNAAVAAPAAAVPMIGGYQYRIDPIVPAGTPGTVLLPVTKHVLSVGRPPGGEAETFVPYCVRVSVQCGADPNWAANVQGGIKEFGAANGATDDPATWPLVADRFFSNQLHGYDDPYITPEDRAKQADAKAAWAADIQRMQQAASTPEAAAQRVHVARNRGARQSAPPAPVPAPAPAVGDAGTPVPIQ